MSTSEQKPNVAIPSVDGLFLSEFFTLSSDEDMFAPKHALLQSIGGEDLSFRQSKASELFSRLKFTAIELQSKLLFLTTLYEEMGEDGCCGESVDKHILVAKDESKAALKKLKDELEKLKGSIADQCDLILNKQKSASLCVKGNRLLSEEILELEQQAASLAERIEKILSTKNLTSTMTIEEGEAALEKKKLQMSDLKTSIHDVSKLIQEAKLRLDREDLLYKELAAECDRMDESVNTKKAHVIQRDATVEELYHMYDGMTRIIQEAFGASCFMEHEYPYRLCIHLRNDAILGDRNFFVTFDKRGSVLSIQDAKQDGVDILSHAISALPLQEKDTVDALCRSELLAAITFLRISHQNDASAHSY
ncbi:hypothetical protein MDAP_002236 [Mitosporidium daphniae]